jgi:hydrogenase maturation protease
MAKELTVLGVGNFLRMDEGIGVHAVRALADRSGGSKNVDFLDGGTLGLNLLPFIEGARSLLILDAVDAGLPPGTVIELMGDAIPQYAGIKLSEHQVTLREVLGLARVRGRLPTRMMLIGMQPAKTDAGDSLSATAAAVLPAILDMAAQVIQDWTPSPFSTFRLADLARPGKAGEAEGQGM